MGPHNAVIAGAWFLLRELELATARVSHVEVAPDEKWVRWRLPASKTDARALGVSRTHFCACSEANGSGCAVHAVVKQLRFLRLAFPRGWLRPEDLLLFPSEAGEACTKASMTATFCHAGVLLGVVEPANGSERISGHSLRVTGAQGLTRLGIDLWAVQLIGRWGSDTVRAYVREVQLERASHWASRAARAPDIDDLVNTVLERANEAGAWSSQRPAPPELSARHAQLQASLTAPFQELVEAEGSNGVAYTVVENPLSAIWHAIGRRGDGAEAQVSLCGWRFGSAQPVDQDSLPATWHNLCAKCFPRLRDTRKSRCRSELRGQNGGSA